MQQAFNDAKQLINSSNHILLTMHERMDGDDGGSVLALARHLEKQGKNVTCAIKQGVPKALEFLPGSHKIQDDFDEHAEYDLLIAFGCSNLDRTGNPKILNHKSSAKGALPASGWGSTSGGKIPIINIDHHPDNENFGHVNIVDAKKSSVAELVYDLFLHHSWPIDKDIATCLLTGIIADTGSFQHSNTQASTLKVASELMRKGASAEKIFRHTFKKDPQVLKAWGKALSNLHYDEKRKIIYSVMTEKDLENLGQLPKSAFEGLAETLNTFPEAKFAMFLRQEGDIIKGSLRTDPFKKTDVAQIAKIFGGGGHKMAAGFSVAGRLVKNEGGRWRVI